MEILPVLFSVQPNASVAVAKQMAEKQILFLENLYLAINQKVYNLPHESFIWIEGHMDINMYVHLFLFFVNP